MSYFVLLGRQEMYGNQAIPSSITPHIYNGFRFRDPLCIDTGRTKEAAINPIFTEDMYIQVLSTTQSDGIKEYTDVDGFVWHSHSGNKPLVDKAFVRHPNNKHIDDRPDRDAFGVQCTEKQQTPSSDGYIMSSTIKIQKERGVIT
jgi:hypothetical protein